MDSCPSHINNTVDAALVTLDSGFVGKSCESPHTDNDLVAFCIVRGDLSMGQQFAQLLHAAGTAALEPHPENTVAVALRCRDQEHLRSIADQLTKRNIPHILISECDGELMACGVIPTRDRKAVNRVTSNLPLLK